MSVRSRASAGWLLDHSCNMPTLYSVSKVSLIVLTAAYFETTGHLLQPSTIVEPIQPILFSIQARSAVSHARVAFQRLLPTIGLGADE